LKATSDWQPATSDERNRAIDILRGLALFGVLMVNLLTMFRVPLLEHILRPYTDPARANYVVDLLVSGALEFKAVTIFSFLFGVGVAIQAERATARNVGARTFLVRRLLWLFVLGTAHMFLIWNGDILALYGVCGLLLLPFLNLRWPPLFVLGAALIALPEIVSLGPPLPSGRAAAVSIAQAREIYGNAGFLAILKFRWHEAWSIIMPLLISFAPRTAGLMYWGMAAWRSRIMREPNRHRGKLAVAFAIGASVGAVLTINGVLETWTGSALWPALRVPHVDASIPLALAYVAGLLLCSTTWRTSSLSGLAATGRMALTNYLLQSIVLGFVFYGYGFGLFGQIGSAAAASIGVVLYVTQIQFSRLWLQRFRFGPFEWLWRSLAYGHRQPILRGREFSSSALGTGVAQ